jgi:hypothetical protein
MPEIGIKATKKKKKKQKKNIKRKISMKTQKSKLSIKNFMLNGYFCHDSCLFLIPFFLLLIIM